MQVVQALHSCFLYDTVSFLDEARFHRLLPLLVSQLAAQPPTTVSALFGAQQTPSAAPELGTDLFGDAVVSALVQMAVTANNDALWKSLNHQVCLTEPCGPAAHPNAACAVPDQLLTVFSINLAALLPGCALCCVSDSALPQLH